MQAQNCADPLTSGTMDFIPLPVLMNATSRPCFLKNPRSSAR